MEVIHIFRASYVTHFFSIRSTGYVKISKMLIDKGADLDIPDKWGQTPLILAAYYSNFYS